MHDGSRRDPRDRRANRPTLLGADDARRLVGRLEGRQFVRRARDVDRRGGVLELVDARPPVPDTAT